MQCYMSYYKHKGISSHEKLVSWEDGGCNKFIQNCCWNMDLPLYSRDKTTVRRHRWWNKPGKFLGMYMEFCKSIIQEMINGDYNVLIGPPEHFAKKELILVICNKINFFMVHNSIIWQTIMVFYKQILQSNFKLHWFFKLCLKNNLF